MFNKLYEKLFGKNIVNSEPVVKEKPEYGLLPLHASPPDDSLAEREKYWEYKYRDGDTFYNKVKVEDHWEWHVNEEKTEECRKKKADQEAVQKYKLELWANLQTKILTDSELNDVIKYGISLVPYAGGVWYSSYGGWSKEFYEQQFYCQRIFNEAFLQQIRLRTVKEAIKPKKNEKTGKPTKRKSLNPYKDV